MPYKKVLVLAGCMATLVLTGCDPVSSPKGKYDDTLGPTKHRVWIAADGTVTRIETDVGGIWESATPVQGDDAGEGAKILDIKLFQHDGSLTALKEDDGTQHGKETHVHTGGQNPPWNGHCHKVWYSGGQKLTSHC